MFPLTFTKFAASFPLIVEKYLEKKMENHRYRKRSINHSISNGYGIS